MRMIWRSWFALIAVLATVRNASAILKRSRQLDPAVSEIQVFHQTGIVVHTTDAGHREPVAADILLA